ncbi:hypothetical protein BAU15_07395 [Enterococcus sp. JM4C]|uniref:DUF7006 family protein n=1 Tax=Candidatus Enterococcus huntleyi TaxID=1857217 RepID=UPI001379EBE4|nr:hypothetical protein [Enterococcus sp. JM4C]KAF1297531.1 hypothetical protein BAU15_07395 [Enterococcus sp. JM4C]
MTNKISLISKEVEAYFSDYDQSLQKHALKPNTEKLSAYYKAIKREFSRIIIETSEETYLGNIEKTLTLDAKLQILFFFWLETDLHNCSEDEIISIVEKDCHTYYKESMDCKLSTTLPTPFLQRIS